MDRTPTSKDPEAQKSSKSKSRRERRSKRSQAKKAQARQGDVGSASQTQEDRPEDSHIERKSGTEVSESPLLSGAQEEGQSKRNLEDTFTSVSDSSQTSPLAQVTTQTNPVLQAPKNQGKIMSTSTPQFYIIGGEKIQVLAQRNATTTSGGSCTHPKKDRVKISPDEFVPGFGRIQL